MQPEDSQPSVALGTQMELKGPPGPGSVNPMVEDLDTIYTPSF